MPKPGAEYSDVIHAAETGNVFRLKQILRGRYATTHLPDNTPLLRASENGHIEAVKLLVEYGLPIQTDVRPSLNGILMAALDNGQVETLAYLLNFKEDALNLTPFCNIYQLIGKDEAAVDQAYAFLLGHPSCSADDVAVYGKNYRLSLENLRDDSEPESLLLDEGKPTHQLLTLAGSGLLAKFFEPGAWSGKERQAMALFKKIRDVLPEYYHPRLDAIDLTAFRPNEKPEPWTVSATRKNTTVDFPAR